MKGKERPEKTNPQGPKPSRSSGADRSDSTLQVLSRAQRGDRSAVRILIERTVPTLRRGSHGRIPKEWRGTADTEDLVQEAVLRTLKRGGAFEHRSVRSLQKYLRTTVDNSIRDIGRRVRARGAPVELPETLPIEAPSPEDQAIMQERSEKFSQALAGLSPRDRLLLIWRYEFGWSYEEIAQRLGKSLDATQVMMSRARARLKKTLGQ